MKMTTEHYNYIKERIDKVIAENPGVVESYKNNDFPRAELTKDKTKRFCFDLLRASVPSKWICDELYPYIADPHIYTALKRICPSVTD